jgi:hypothetical protein
MSVSAFYRLCIWLPILVPASVIVYARLNEVNLADGIVLEVLAYSFWYGGLPYALLATWATVWVGGRSEAEVRRLMFRAPFLFAGVFAVLVLVVGVIVGASRQFAALAIFGCLIILPLGYAYVGAVVMLRRVLGPPLVGDPKCRSTQPSQG